MEVMRPNSLATIPEVTAPGNTAGTTSGHNSQTNSPLSTMVGKTTAVIANVDSIIVNRLRIFKPPRCI